MDEYTPDIPEIMKNAEFVVLRFQTASERARRKRLLKRLALSYAGLAASVIGIIVTHNRAGRNTTA